MTILVITVQVRGVLDAMPSTNLKPEEEEELEENRVYRTTYMFSATMPPAVERLARKYMRRPVVINIGSAGKATDNVTQVRLLLGAQFVLSGSHMCRMCCSQAMCDRGYLNAEVCGAGSGCVQGQ